MTGAFTRRTFLTAAGASRAAMLRAQSPSEPVKDKIASVKAWPVALRLNYKATPPRFKSDFDPARWKWRGPFAQLTGAIIVEIKTQQGLAGYGMGGGGAASAIVIEHHLRDFLMGSDPLNIELLNDQMYSSTTYYGRKGIAVLAISGVDLALWDIAGKHTGKPVHQLLGGTTKDKVPAYFTAFDPEPGLKLGFKAFKIPLTEGVAQGRESMKRIVSRLTEVRNTIGPEAELMVECNSLWDVPYTLEMADRLAPVRPYLFEEPLSPENIAGYEILCDRIRGPRIASGEHEYTRYGFGELIRHKAVQILQPDLTWSGGLTEVRRIAALASAHSLPVMPHRGGSSYGMALIAATPNCHMAESFGIGESGNDLMAALTARFENGYYYPNAKPGFGIPIDEKMVRKFAHD